MIHSTERVEIEDVEMLDCGSLVMRCRVGDRVVWVPSLGKLPGTEIERQGDRGSSSFRTTSLSISVSPRLAALYDSDPQPRSRRRPAPRPPPRSSSARPSGGGVPALCRLGVAHCTGTVPDLCVQDYRIDAERVIEGIAPVDTCPNGCPPQCPSGYLGCETE
jgi:hypothetical protein